MGFLLLVLANIQTITSLKFNVILNLCLHRLRRSYSNPSSLPLIPKLNNRDVLLIITDTVDINYASSPQHFPKRMHV